MLLSRFAGDIYIVDGKHRGVGLNELVDAPVGYIQILSIESYKQ
jgi:hypothetical protein